jgi:hypothetical protein
MGGDWLSWEASLVRIKAQTYLAAPRATGRQGDGATGGRATRKIFFRPASPSPRRPVAPSPLSFRPHIPRIARRRRPQLLQKRATGLRSNH